MNRPQRQVKAPQRLIEQDVPEPAKRISQSRRTLNLDIPKVDLKRDVVQDVIDRPKITKRKTKSGIKQTLHLNLDDVPPSDDKKMKKDWGLSPYWQTHFYTPKDKITKLYVSAVDKFEFGIPISFRLEEDVEGGEGAIGIGNLELKDEFKKPIKQIPLFSKLMSGAYQTASSKSDKNIAGTISFFRNNLPSFKKYKDEDNISWVVKEHRLLTAELLNYYGDSESKRIATLKGRFNAITRIFRIAFETKAYDLYEKFSTCVIFLGQYFDDDEYNNELSEIELKKFITFDVVLDKQKELQKQFELIQNKKTQSAYDLNQDLLLVSLYSLIPPLRNEIKTLKFNTIVQKKEDWIVIKPDGDVVMDLNEEKKRHDAILFNITEESPQLAEILKESYRLYPRVPLFTPYKSYPDVSTQAKPQSLSDRITSIFSFTGKKVSVNTFRSSYVSYANSQAIKRGRQMTIKDKEKLAYRMRTSRKYLDEAYLKIFPIEQEAQQNQDYEDFKERRPLTRETDAKIINVVPIQDKLPAYQSKLTRNKKYYDENKDKVLKKQKEYKDNRPAYDKARVRLLHYLNNDASYIDRMKDATKQKYDFKKENGKWI
jgi:hypothetical protein